VVAVVAPEEVEPSRVSAPELPDIELAHAARGRDRRACFVIGSRHATLVERLVRRFLGPGLDCQDIGQEVFLGLFKRAGRTACSGGTTGFRREPHAGRGPE
jgi:hypothetical protein